MSVPAANALSPPPVIRIARTERSSFAASQISARRSYMAKVSAFLACGRLNVTYATPSRTSWSSSGVMPSFAVGRIDLVELPQQRRPLEHAERAAHLRQVQAVGRLDHLLRRQLQLDVARERGD